MNIRPLFIFRFRDTLNGAAIAFGVLLLALGVLTAVTAQTSASTNITVTAGLEATAAIVVFIIGICSARDDLRLALQNGVGRRSAFVSSLLAMAAVSAVVCLGIELIYAALGALNVSTDQFTVASQYQLLFLGETAPLTLGVHVRNFCLTWCILVCADLCGRFFSLLFFRLNAVGSVIAAVLMGLLLFVGTPLWLSTQIEALEAHIDLHPALLALTFLLGAVLAGLIDWLLLRRAPIRAARR